MKSGTALVAILFASASFPLLAQQPSTAPQPGTPATPSTTQTAPPATPQTSSAPMSPVTPMSPVNGELVSKLDSKTAKSGDSVEVRTEASVKTSDGTEIPKGSKLVGHVLAVQPSGAGTNSQVVLQFDHIELKGGQTLPVHSQIQAISPAGMASEPPATAGAAANTPPASGPSGAPNAGVSSPNSNQRAGSVPQTPSSESAAAPAPNGAPPPGTVVVKNGNIAIATTAIPGVLLANNAPGQQDPRMAKASSILLGARKDIQLDGGTQMVIGVSAAGGGGQ